MKVTHIVAVTEFSANTPQSWKMDGHEKLGVLEFPPGVKNLTSDMNPTEMVKALKKCCKFFSELEQDEDGLKINYLPFSHYIVQDEFLKEVKDETCRIHIGCIIADIFRFYAPENKFQSSEKVKDIFLFLIEQLKQLEDKGSLYPKAFHILQILATVKTFNICTDLDDSSAVEEIFCSLFKMFFNTVQPRHDKQVKAHMLDIMDCTITDSGSTLPQSILDIVLENLLDRTRKMNPTAYELAQDLLRRIAVVVESFIMKFFQSVVFENKHEVSRLSSNWRELILELYKITPSLLFNTFNQLSYKLKDEKAKERLQMVTLLSQMFAKKDSELATQHTALWNCFLGRFNDIDAEVRVACVNFCRNHVINHGRDSAASNEVISFIKPRRHDTDESVRIAVVLCIRGIAMKDLKLATDELLEFLKERVLDKKWRVREAVIRAMGDIYKKYTVCDGGSRLDMRRIQSFRSKLLQVYYRQSMEDCMLLERVVVSSLVPYTLPNASRMKQLLELYATVDDHAVKALLEMLKKQRSLRVALKDIVEAFKLTEEEEQNKTIWHKVVFIASQMPGNQHHARENIKKFIRIAYRDAKIKQWLTYVVGTNYTSQKVAVAVRDLIKKLEKDGVAKAVRDTAQHLLERAIIVPVLIDPPSMKILFDLVKETLNRESDIQELNTKNAQRRVMELLKSLSRIAPYLFSSAKCFEDLLSFLGRTKDDHVVQQSLIILEHTASYVEESFTEIRSVFLPELKNKAKTGTATQVKHAIYCINKFVSVREKLLLEVFNHCKNIALTDDIGHQQMETVLTALGCIAEVIPEKAASELRSVVASVVVKQVILKTTNVSNTPKSKKKEIKWCEKCELSKESKTKIAGMKCMVRWLHGLRSDELNCCTSTLRLLQHMLHNEGDIMKSGIIPKADMSHLRLQAACCVLKIAQVSEFKDLFKPDIYLELAMLINDSVLEVRRNFVIKLYETLYKFQIHISFLALFATVSQETIKEQRDNGTYLYHQLIKRMREFNKQNTLGTTKISTMMPEFMLPYLVYLLANDPDFLEGISKRSLARIKDCIHFILGPLLIKDHPESFGFIKRLAESLKRTKNVANPADTQRNENVYAVCDLIVQHVLQRSSQHAVAILEPSDEAVFKFIPLRIYTQPSGPENNKIYLPREFYTNLKLVPTPATTAAMGGDRYRRNLAHQSTSGFATFFTKESRKQKNQLQIFGGNAKKRAQPTISSPSTPTVSDSTSQLTASTSQSTTSSTSRSEGKYSSPKRPVGKASVSSSLTLPTPPTSQTMSSQDSTETATPPVRTSGRKRKPKNYSPPPISTPVKRNKPSSRQQRRDKRNADMKDSMGDEASDEENDMLEDSPAASSARIKNSTPKLPPKGKIEMKGKRNVIASASVKTKPRKMLEVNNGNSSSNTDSPQAVRRSSRRRGK